MTLTTVPAWGMTFNVVGTLVILRVCEKPVLALMAYSDESREEELVTPLRQILLFTLPAYPLIVIFSLYVSAKAGGLHLVDDFERFLTFRSIFRNAVMTPLWLMSAVWIACFVRQYQILNHLARTLPTPVLPMPDYTPVAEPFMRLTLASIFVVAAFPVLDVVIDSPEADFLVDVVAAGAAVLGVPLTLAFLRPILVLQGRFQAEKQTQLTAIQSELNQAIGQDADKVPTLLTRQMYIESRPTWPIAANVQRLVLFGLLPPLTWVMAAIVENLLY